ncbi:MAG: 4-hydroxy-tetrahydrodipicolinate reductase [Coxiellaceae bacterium]|nr:4-hydroxy-tetrahydrodipicolinate reductase [Coxiellaceae bacterium]
MSIKIIVNGAKGKMGTYSIEAIEQADGLTLVGTADRDDNLGQMIDVTKADTVVDFTVADCAFENAKTIIKHGARPIIGTSGLTEQTVAELAKLCKAKKIGGVIAPNFALGAVLMMKLAQQVAPYYQFAEIIEMHHPHKKDAPSGTATRTAEMMHEANPNFEQPYMEDRARGDNQHGVPIHSVRMQGVFTHQSVVFGSLEETLTITHDCSDRKAAMPGVVLACHKVMQLNDLVYGLEHLL